MKRDLGNVKLITRLASPIQVIKIYTVLPIIFSVSQKYMWESFCKKFKCLNLQVAELKIK